MAARRLVGRPGELDALRLLLDSLPTGGVALVEGEPGIGKSALLRWAVEEATSRGVRTVQLQGERPTSARPFAMFQGMARAAEPDTVGMLGLEQRIDQMLDGAPGESMLLTIDDVQWADAKTLRSLAPIVRRAVNGGSAVIVAARTHPQSVELTAFFERVAPLVRAHLRLRPLCASSGAVRGSAGGRSRWTRPLAASPAT